MWIDGKDIDWKASREKIARHLSTVLTHGEPDGCENKPDLRQLLVFLDNAEDSMALRLKDQLESILERRGEEKRSYTIRTLVNILYLVPTSGTRQSRKRSGINQASIEITHELSDEEMKLFKTTLDKLEKRGIEPSSILEFVVLASNFKPKEGYIEGVVDEALHDIEIYQNQGTLILYLSMLTKFGSHQRFALPEKHCQNMLCSDESGSPQRPFMEGISFQARKFLIRDAKDPKKVMIRVPHEPVAKHLYNALIKKMSTSDVVIQMLMEKKVGKSWKI